MLSKRTKITGVYPKNNLPIIPKGGRFKLISNELTNVEWLKSFVRILAFNLVMLGISILAL